MNARGWGVVAAATVSGCCVWSHSRPSGEGDRITAVEPALVKQAVADRDGVIDEAACRRACAALDGEVRGCRFTTRVVETAGSTSVVACYRFPADGSKEYLAKKVAISEAQRDALKLGPRNTLVGGCFQFCDIAPGESMTCTLEPGRPRVSKTEPAVVCHMHWPGGCGPVTFGN